MTRRRIFVWSSVALALGALGWASKAAVVLRDRPQWLDDFDRHGVAR